MGWVRTKAQRSPISPPACLLFRLLDDMGIGYSRTGWELSQNVRNICVCGTRMMSRMLRRSPALWARGASRYQYRWRRNERGPALFVHAPHVGAPCEPGAHLLLYGCWEVGHEGARQRPLQRRCALNTHSARVLCSHGGSLGPFTTANAVSWPLLCPPETDSYHAPAAAGTAAGAENGV
ncbi:hypothetical protein DFH06DRAFT_1238063 [Mycena polygramma]|nr:hypothetical protein DFH06DRAFT_1238063 [Mycena polygramma]